MKQTISLALFWGALSFSALSQELILPINNVSVTEIEDARLSLQNLSDSNFTIDIYGEEFVMSPDSGVSYECAGYAFLEIQVKGMIHDYAEVPCNSRVSFMQNFTAVE